MTFKKSMSLILVLTMVLGLFSTGVFVNQAQASETEATLRPISSVSPDDLVPADGTKYLGTKPTGLNYYLAANLNDKDYYITATQTTTYGLSATDSKGSATPVTLALDESTGTCRIAYWASSTSTVATYFMCFYANTSDNYAAGGRTRLSDTTATRLKDLTLNSDGTISLVNGETTMVLVCCTEQADSSVYMRFVDASVVAAAEAGTYAYVYLKTSAGAIISSVADFPEKDIVALNSYTYKGEEPNIFHYYLIADLQNTRYYFKSNTGTVSGVKSVTALTDATPVSLAQGATGGYRIIFWSHSTSSSVKTYYRCIYFDTTNNVSTSLVRMDDATAARNKDFTLNADGTISVTVSGTEYALVCKIASDSNPYMGFVEKAKVDAAEAGTYAYVYLTAQAAPLSNETPTGYQVLDNLPQNAGDQVNNLYAGVYINGNFNVITSTSTVQNDMRYFPVTSDASKYPTSSVINGSDIENSEGYMLVFGKTGSTSTYAFSWDSANRYFTNNGIQASGAPDGGFAAKHSFSYDSAEKIFTHTYGGVKYILGMKATDSGVRTYTYTEAIMAAATNDPIYPVRLYEDVSTVRYNVQLNSILRVKFYVPTGDNTVKIAVNNAAEAVVAPSGTENVGSIAHNVYYVDVMAQDMLQPITASVYNAEGAKIDGKTFTLESYVAKVEASGAEANVVNLAKAALVYCQYAAANKYPDVYTATADVTIPEGALAGFTFTKTEGTTIGLNAYLDEACALQLLIPVSDAAGYTVTVDGTVTALSTKKTIGDIEYYVCKIDKILPQDYAATHTFVVKNAEGAVVYEATASVLGYISYCLENNQGTEAAQNLMSAMYHYWYAAFTYTTGTTPESLQLEAFTIVADSKNAELANTLAANIQSTHGVTLAVDTSGNYTGSQAIYLGTDKEYNSFGGYRYNICTKGSSIYVNGTAASLTTAADALVSSIKNTEVFPFGLETSTTGYEWYNNATDTEEYKKIFRTPLGYTLQSSEYVGELADGVEMYKLTYKSSNTAEKECLNCGKTLYFGSTCWNCDVAVPDYSLTVVAYAVVLRNGSEAKFQMVTAGYDPNQTYTTSNPAPTMTVQNLAAKLESEHSEYKVLAITNGGFAQHDGGDGTEVPWGMQIVDGVVKHAPEKDSISGNTLTRKWFGVNSSGKYIVGDANDGTDYSDIQQGVNGSHYIFKNGKPAPFLLGDLQTDHTMVAYTENNDMVLLTMTSCNAAMAAQAFMDLSLIAEDLEVYYGINMDGGGSTGMYTSQLNGTLTAAYVSNKDGHARAVSDAVAIVIPKN